jgi:hypothetical protein
VNAGSLAKVDFQLTLHLDDETLLLGSAAMGASASFGGRVRRIVRVAAEK